MWLEAENASSSRESSMRFRTNWVVFFIYSEVTFTSMRTFKSNNRIVRVALTKGLWLLNHTLILRWKIHLKSSFIFVLLRQYSFLSIFLNYWKFYINFYSSFLKIVTLSYTTTLKLHLYCRPLSWGIPLTDHELGSDKSRVRRATQVIK